MSDGQKDETVAVVGSGIAGLSCAWLLSQSPSSSYSVTIIEREPLLGMDAHGITLEDGTRIDTPPRAFSRGFYPNLMALYEAAGVPIERWSWDFSCSRLGQRAYYRIRRHLGHSVLGFSLPEIGGLWQMIKFFLTPSSYVFMYEAVRFYSQMKRDRGCEEKRNLSLREYLKQGNFSSGYVYGGLVPMLSMVCTCKYESVLDYPAGVIFDYMLVNQTNDQYRSARGSSESVTRLSRHADRIILGARVKAVHPAGRDGSSKATVEYVNKDGKEQSARFDRVVIASEATVAKAILAPSCGQTVKQELAKFRYEGSSVVIHRDRALMPVDKADWSVMNIISTAQLRSMMFTMWASHKDCLDLDESKFGPLFQTWNPNPTVSVDEDKVLKRIHFNRSLVDGETRGATESLWDLQGQGGLYFVGAYAIHAVPLQENAVRSSVRVAKLMGCDVPWESTNSPSTSKEEDCKKTAKSAGRQGLLPFCLAASLLGIFWN